MDQVESGLMMKERKRPQPAQKFVPVGCGQNVAEGIPMLGSGNPFCHGQKVKVMVSEDTDCGIAQGPDGSKRFSDLGPRLTRSPVNQS